MFKGRDYSVSEEPKHGQRGHSGGRQEKPDKNGEMEVSRHPWVALSLRVTSVTDDRYHSQTKQSAKQRFKPLWEQGLKPQGRLQEGGRLWTKSWKRMDQILPLPVYANKVALGQSHAHSFTVPLAAYVLQKGRTGESRQRPLGLQTAIITIWPFTKGLLSPGVQGWAPGRKQLDYVFQRCSEWLKESQEGKGTS